MSVDKRNRFANEVFSYRAYRDERVEIFWEGKPVKTLKGHKAQAFLAAIAELEQRDAQLVMAKLTGNFKRGNERR